MIHYTIHTDDGGTRNKSNPTGRVDRRTYTLPQARKRIAQLEREDRNRKHPRIIKYHLRASK